VTLFGKRRTGKSTAAKHIVSILKEKIDRFMVVSGNKGAADSWDDLVHPLYIHDMNRDCLKTLIKYQNEKLGKIRKAYKRRHGRRAKLKKIPRKMRVCVIIDDCGHDASFMNSPEMMDITANGRHYGIDLIICCQYFNQLGTKNRNQIDYIGHLYTDNVKSTKKVYDEYVGKTCRTFNEFNYIFGICTQNVGQICWIDNTVTIGSDDPGKKIFYKSIPDPDDPQNEYRHRVGSRRVKSYAKLHSADTYDVNDEEYEKMRRMTSNYIDRNGDRLEIRKSFASNNRYEDDNRSMCSAA